MDVGVRFAKQFALVTGKVSVMENLNRRNFIAGTVVAGGVGLLSPKAAFSQVDNANDYQALISLITNAGSKPVELKPGATYHIDRPLIFTLVEDLTVNGNGAKIVLNSKDVVNDAVYFMTSSEDGGGNFNLTIRDLFIDANKRSYRGLHVRNEKNKDHKDATLIDVRVENAYRSGREFLGGDGIFVRGGFERVNIKNPVVKNINMAADAGIEGSEGVFGITVTRTYDGMLAPKYVTIENPYIDNISCDDNTYRHDQDGIRLFGLEHSATKTEEGSCRIVGGVFKNCWGRSIKVQRNDCVVIGSSFHRDGGFDTGYGNSEIDFQYGSGQVSNIFCHYDGFNPTVIVNSTSGNRNQIGFSVDGINATLMDTTLVCAVQRYRGSQPQQATPVYVKNVSISGRTEHMIHYDTNVGTAEDPSQYCVAENCYADEITGAFLRIRGSGNTNRVIIRNCADRSGKGTPLIRENVVGNVAFADLSASGNQGLTGGEAEGTWAARIAFGGDDAGVQYTTRLGNYSRVNNQVTCTLFLVLANRGVSTGNVAITGLPFPIKDSPAAYAAASIGSVRNIAFEGQLQAWGEIGTNRINIGQTNESGAYSPLNHAGFKNNSEIILTFSYFTDGAGKP